VQGRNARNLSVQISLSQTNKNAMSLLLPLMFSLQQNWKRGQNRFCLEEGVEVDRGVGQGREMAQIYMNKCINNKKRSLTL
jgi:hypothetical protein